MKKTPYNILPNTEEILRTMGEQIKLARLRRNLSVELVAENSQGIIGIQMASAYIGSTLMPPLFGLIANHISLNLMPFYLAFFLMLMVVMISKTERLCNLP